VAHQVLLVSSDPFLLASLTVAARGHFAVQRIDPVVEPAGWPWQAASAVVLDVAPEQRAGMSAWVRRHHSGPLLVLLKPDEPDKPPPSDPARVVVRRPFRIIDLLDVLTAPAGPESTPERLRPSGRFATGGRELQHASFEQRRRRLESVAGGGERPRPVTSRAGAAAPPSRPPAPRDRARPPPGRPAPGRHPSATARSPSKRRRRAARRRVIVRSTLLGALVALLLAGGWLAIGLFEARQELRLVAGSVRSDLTRAEAALRRGDLGVAGAALRDASLSIEVADAVTERLPFRVAARLPLLSGGARDAGHLLSATRELVRAGDHAVLLAGHLQPGGSALLERGRFDLRALESATDQTRLLAAELERARTELLLIRGGPLSEGLEETKGWALGRIDDARARVRGIRSTLETLPVALGVGRPQTYLIALLTPAELRPSGGVPLAVMEVVLDDGAVRVRSHGGDLADNVHTVQTTWKAVAGDPWASGGSFTRFSQATSSPDFPTAGQELLRAYAARNRRRADVVVTFDPMAMRALLQATGPVTVPGYGRLTANTVVRRTTHDAYVTWPDRVVRRRHNEGLLDALVDRFLSGRELIATSRVLGAAGARRSVQMYAVDPRLQRLLAGQRLAGGLGPADHDYLAVHTLNTNRSRVDYFQRRSVQQRVQLRQDGSAEVTRTIVVASEVPTGGPLDPDVAVGYGSARAASVLATYLPSGATLAEASVDGRRVRPAVARERGRPLLRLPLELAPGKSAKLTIRYRAKAAAVPAGQGLRYLLAADPQVMIRPPTLRIEVVAPPGFRVVAADGWALRGGGAAVLDRPFDGPIAATLDLRRT
jgi:Protein of unknown function (DUF4012)